MGITPHTHFKQMARTLPTIIRFGYDKKAGVHARGYARSDWSLCALEDSRGFGWKIKDRYGNLSPIHMSQAEAIDILLDA